MSEWYSVLNKAGFTGNQTPGLPYHISLASFPLDEERKAAELVQKVSEEYPAISVHISHIGIFSPGRVLFGAPELNTGLMRLHDACDKNADSNHPWTPHVTMLIDEPETISRAVPLFISVFSPFVGTITRLHLCAF